MLSKQTWSDRDPPSNSNSTQIARSIGGRRGVDALQSQPLESLQVNHSKACAIEVPPAQDRSSISRATLDYDLNHSRRLTGSFSATRYALRTAAARGVFVVELFAKASHIIGPFEPRHIGVSMAGRNCRDNCAQIHGPLALKVFGATNSSHRE